MITAYIRLLLKSKIYERLLFTHHIETWDESIGEKEEKNSDYAGF